MNTFVLMALCALVPVISGAQSNWAPVDMTKEGWEIRVMYEDTVENCLWVGGLIWDNDFDQNEYLMKYDGEVWTAYGPFNGQCYAIIRYNNQLIIGGSFDEYQGNYCSRLAVWNNGTFVPLAGDVMNSTGSGYGVIWTLAEIENDLYIGGSFGSIHGIVCNKAAIYHDTLIATLNNFTSLYKGDDVFTISNYLESPYLGGVINLDTGFDIANYQDNNWLATGGGLLGGLSWISDMEEFNSELVVAGSFYLGAGNTGSFIQKWNGEQWSALGEGLRGSDGTYNSNGQVKDLLLHDNKLYIGGVFDFAGDIVAHRICYWDGEKFCALGGVFTNNVNALAFYQDTLYIGSTINCEIDGQLGKGLWKFTAGSSVESCSTVDVERIEDEFSLTLSPNPASTTLTVQSTTPFTRTTIFDLAGRELHSETFNSIKRAVLSIERLSPGIYILSVQTEGGTVCTRFVKE